MYSRFSNARGGMPSGIRLPPNYSGNAFSVQPAEPEKDGAAPLDFSGLPRVSDLTHASDAARTDSVPPELLPAPADSASAPEEWTQAAPPDMHRESQPLLPGLLGGGLLGQEEIILIGLCLLLLHESLESDCGRGDLTETLLLLGALLLSGS